MHKQKRVNETAGADLTYLPRDWDSALLGFVERGGSKNRHVHACYGYQAMKAVLLKERKLTPEQVYAHIKQVTNSLHGPDIPIILTRMKRQPMWDAIRRNKYPTWEYMNRAILGLGYAGWKCTGVVYSKSLCASILQEQQSTNNDNELQDYAQALTTIEDTLVPLDLGEFTPWFLTCVQ